MKRAEPDGDDPLAYMTTDYPSGALFESRMAMSFRMIDRGRNAPRRWQRVATYMWIVTALAVTIGGLVFWTTLIVLKLT